MPTRREFISTTAFMAGLAIAAQPSLSNVIITDSEGLIAGSVKIPVGDGTLLAYRALPAKSANLPVVLVVQEIFGVHSYIEDICRRLAKLGYLAIAPHLFQRQGDVLKLADVDQIRQVVAKVPDAQVMSDLDAATRWAGKHGGNTQRLGITGFCWGGRIVWLYAAHNPQLKAGVAWYGRLVAPSPNPLTPTYPMDVVNQLKAPVLGLYGGEDPLIPNAQVEEFQKRLAAQKSPAQIVLYPGMPHGFHADYRASYRPEAAADGWRRMQSWFQRYGV
ncbi:MAG: dienelactone hydrolase family protein [Pseudanabaenaceae cyanobacterium bins.68]|nr:dienelactone hydrolase family protein [Pseudanabaenaceae cyanobacterium bins.68]